MQEVKKEKPKEEAHNYPVYTRQERAGRREQNQETENRSSQVRAGGSRARLYTKSYSVSEATAQKAKNMGSKTEWQTNTQNRKDLDSARTCAARFLQVFASVCKCLQVRDLPSKSTRGWINADAVRVLMCLSEYRIEYDSSQAVGSRESRKQNGKHTACSIQIC